MGIAGPSSSGDKDFLFRFGIFIFLCILGVLINILLEGYCKLFNENDMCKFLSK